MILQFAKEAGLRISVSRTDFLKKRNVLPYLYRNLYRVFHELCNVQADMCAFLQLYFPTTHHYRARNSIICCQHNAVTKYMYHPVYSLKNHDPNRNSPCFIEF